MAINPENTYECIKDPYEKGMLDKPLHVSDGMTGYLHPSNEIGAEKSKEIGGRDGV